MAALAEVGAFRERRQWMWILVTARSLRSQDNMSINIEPFEGCHFFCEMDFIFSEMCMVAALDQFASAAVVRNIFRRFLMKLLGHVQKGDRLLVS